jgi:hypothetical protein
MAAPEMLVYLFSGLTVLSSLPAWSSNVRGASGGHLGGPSLSLVAPIALKTRRLSQFNHARPVATRVRNVSRLGSQRVFRPFWLMAPACPVA